MIAKYKAVVIGLGRIGAQEWLYQNNIKPVTHAAAFLAHPKIKLSGLCDTDPKNLKSASVFFKKVPSYAFAPAMLRETNPDIVSIATHPDTHYSLVKLAAEHGVKAIILEKPMADSIKDAEKMIKICRQKKCLLFINHSRHFDTLIQGWQKKVQKGILGKVLQASCLYHNGFLNNGTHMIDLLIMFLGKADKALGKFNQLTSNSKRDENIDAMIFFKEGARATLQSVPAKRRMTEWYFYGTKNDLFLKNLGTQVHFKNKKYGKPRSLSAQMVWHVVECLEGKEKPVSTGKEALEVLKVLFAIKKSTQNNGKVVRVE